MDKSQSNNNHQAKEVKPKRKRIKTKVKDIKLNQNPSIKVRSIAFKGEFNR